MSKLWSKFSGLFSKRSCAGMDKVGNRYFVRNEEIDGIMKEKRWVIFKGESDPTSIPVEWICWLNGQRKQAPTPEEMALFQERREQVRQNVVRLKKEEEERKAKGITGKPISNAKVAGPNLKSFIQQFPVDPEGNTIREESESVSGLRESIETEAGKEEEKTSVRTGEQAESSEPTGSGASYRPGTWQPPA